MCSDPRMKRIPTGDIIAALAFTLVFALVTGCSLIPKPVEFFQKKVEAVPEKTRAQAEAERQAAAYTSDRIGDARDAALIEGASTNVVTPLTDARDAAVGLRYSLGAPEDPWRGSGEELALRLAAMEARLARRLDRYRDEVAPLEGKKIEGTGRIRMPYFVWLGIVAGVLFLLWSGVKLYGTVNPAVGLGVSGLSAAGRFGARSVRRGFEQVVAAGESFKEEVDKLDIDDAVKAKVKELLRTVQMERQDSDVQDVIRKMTR